MTIAAAYLTSEGIVLGADSTTTVTLADGSVAQLLNHAQKVFEIGEPERGRFAFCTFGAGKICTLSHRTIAAFLADWVESNPAATVDEVTKELIRIVETEAHANPLVKFSVGYFVGGRGPNRIPACNRIGVKSMPVTAAPGAATSPPPQVTTSIAALSPGEPYFEAAEIYFKRIFDGIDPHFPAVLLGNLKVALANAGQLPVDLESAFDLAMRSTRPAFKSEGYRELPIRDAIDFVHAFLAITIKAFKFRYGPTPCGGPIEIGFITSDRPFRWAQHKSFESAVVENRHVRDE